MTLRWPTRWKSEIAVPRQLNFLVSAVTATSLSDGILLVVAPLLVAGQHDDPRAVAGVTIAATLPYLLIALPSGILVDRTDRRRLMQGVAAARAVIAGVLVALLGAGATPLLLIYVSVFLLESLRATFDNSAKAVLPNVAGPVPLEVANGRTYAGQIMGDGLLGRALGGLLFTLGAPVAFLCYAAAQLLTVLFTAGSLQHVHLDQPTPQTREMGSTLAWFRKSGPIRSLALLHAVRSFVSGLANGVLVLYALRELHLSPGQYGLLLLALPCGGLIAALVSRTVIEHVGPRWLLTSVMVADCCAYGVLGAQHHALLAVPLLALIAFNGVVWNVFSLSLRQRMVPQDWYGRVQSVYAALQYGLIPLGAACAGVIGSAFGLRIPFFAGAVLLIGAAALSPAVVRQIATAEVTSR